MAAPTEVLWDADEHTFAKHRLLRAYLDAWLPIMSRRNQRLVLIDGFAGPGRYKGGQVGSPLIMLDAFLLHRHRDLPHMARAELAYFFIERDRDRVAHLGIELSRLTLPANIKVGLVQGSFDTELGRLLDELPPNFGLAPTFAFIDPFGYTDHGLELSARILRFPRCEVLIYVPLPFIARFVDQAAVEPAITNLYGDDSWTAARTFTGLAARVAVLHDTFLAALRRSAGYARSFEIVARGGLTGYHLFFGTQHPLGLERMKEAMWRIDPEGGTTFADSTNTNQMTMFEPAPDLTVLAAALRAHFGDREFTIEQAERFTLVETPYAPAIHLKGVLRTIEGDGHLDGRHPAKDRRRNTYPEGTILRFRP